MGVGRDSQSQLADLRPATSASVPSDEVPAGFLRRSAAALIDALVVVAFVFGLSFLLVGGLGLTAPQDGGGSADFPYYAILAIFLLLYFARAESGSHAATWGKRALGLAVRDRHGAPPGFGRALLRLCLRFLTTGTLLLGWLTILVTRRHQALHDLLSGTVVVIAGSADRPDISRSDDQGE